MKTNIAIIVFFILALAVPAQEPYYNYTNILSFTNTIAASTTNTYTGTNYLNAIRYRKADLGILFQGAGNESNNVVYSFVYSQDATNWNYNAPEVVLVAARGTNPVVHRQPLDLTTIGFVKAWQIINTNANDLTNASVPVWTKSAPRN